MATRFLYDVATSERMASRYKLFYEQVVKADLLSKMQYKNVHMIPTMKKISLHGGTHVTMGGGLDTPVSSAFLTELITGQQSKFTRTKRGMAQYKMREGMLEGSKVHLHGDQMWNFMDRLITMVVQQRAPRKAQVAASPCSSAEPIHAPSSSLALARRSCRA